jgi:hypothetical protein
MDIGILEVYRNGMPISLQESHLLLYDEPHYTYDHYIVYSYMKRLGYVVLRTDVYDTKVINKPQKSGKPLGPAKDRREYNRYNYNAENKKHRGWWPASEENGEGTVRFRFFSLVYVEKVFQVEVIPLPKDADKRVYNYADLRVVKSYNLDETSVDLNELIKSKNSMPFRIAFDVFHVASYKRTGANDPMYRLCVTRYR